MQNKNNDKEVEEIDRNRKLQELYSDRKDLLH